MYVVSQNLKLHTHGAPIHTTHLQSSFPLGTYCPSWWFNDWNGSQLSWSRCFKSCCRHHVHVVIFRVFRLWYRRTQKWVIAIQESSSLGTVASFASLKERWIARRWRTLCIDFIRSDIFRCARVIAMCDWCRTSGNSPTKTDIDCHFTNRKWHGSDETTCVDGWDSLKLKVTKTFSLVSSCVSLRFWFDGATRCGGRIPTATWWLPKVIRGRQNKQRSREKTAMVMKPVHLRGARVRCTPAFPKKIAKRYRPVKEQSSISRNVVVQVRHGIPLMESAERRSRDVTSRCSNRTSVKGTSSTENT